MNPSKSVLKEPILTDASDETGKIVNIHDVERGLACKCYCPKCNEPLVAKLGNKDGRQAHFAHYQEGNCLGAQMAAIHRRAIEIIAEKKTVMAPAYKSIKAKELIFDKVEIEQRVERKDLQPDIVGITSGGQRYNIEIRYTHEVDEEKRNKMIASGMTCLEIDIRELNMGNLTTFLLKTKDKREWINNPIYDQIIQEEIQKRPHVFNSSPSKPLKCKEKDNDTHFIEEKLKELRFFLPFSWNGEKTDVIHYDLANKCNGIVILHKSSNPTITPFHVSRIHANGETSNVADYDNLQSAEEKYYSLLNEWSGISR